MMELEADLKSQHQAELNSKISQINQAKEKNEVLKQEITKLKGTIAEQLKQIKTFSASASNTKHLEQQYVN